MNKFHWLHLLLKIFCNMCIVIIRCPACGVIDLKTSLSNITKPFSYMIKRILKKLTSSEEILTWNEKHFSFFVKGYHWNKFWECESPTSRNRFKNDQNGPLIWRNIFCLSMFRSSNWYSISVYNLIVEHWQHNRENHVPRWRCSIIICFYKCFLKSVDNLYHQQDSVEIVRIVEQTARPNIYLLKWKKANHFIEKNSFCTSSLVGLAFTY